MSTKLRLHDRFTYLNTTLDHFWKRFLAEYLPSLHPRRKWTKERKPIQENDIVLLLDDQLPRGCWKMVLVDKISLGEDGRVRQALVRVPGGSILKRPVSKLLPLELESTDV